MKIKLSAVLLLLLTCIGIYAFRADEDPFEVILKKISSYAEEHPYEKVHLHLDKPYYAIGDNIWFKAYVLDSRGGPSTLSHLLYVELIAENDSLQKQIKLPLAAGVTWGDFSLPDSLREGNYRIRAYTQWMRNAGPDYFFDKTIKVGNAWSNKVFTSSSSTYSKKDNEENVNTVIRFTDKQGQPYAGNLVSYVVTLQDKKAVSNKATTNANGEISLSFHNKQAGTPASGNITATLNLANKRQVVKVIPVTATANTVSVQFYPEGGNMVENLPSKIGIKAVNAAGLGQDVSGTVIDNEGNELFEISTAHLGMGSFTINPSTGKTYSVKIKFKDGSTQQFPLPKALPQGYAVTVSQPDSSRILTKVFISEALLNKGGLKLVIQQHNEIYAVLKAGGEKQVISFSAPVKDMPAGVYNLTLFSAENIPVAQRMIFIGKPQDQIELNLPNLKPLYSKRENVPLELSAKYGDSPVQGSFSIAVTNMQMVKPDLENESNILTSLLLKSELRGYIEKPNYYFLNPGQKTRSDLDLLMLTQGWSRILWKDMLAATPATPVYPPEKSLQVSGTITTEGGKPIAGGKVSLFSNTGGLFLIDTLTDDKGRFSFKNLNFGDSTKFLVQARNAKNRKYVEIKLDIIPGQVITKNPNTGDIEVNVNESIKSYIDQSENYFNSQVKLGLLQRTFLLNEVAIVKKQQPKSNSTNLNGPGHADAVLTSKDLANCSSLLQCLQGRIAGVVLRNGQFYLTRNGGGGSPMAIYVDGMELDADFLDQIQPSSVETVEILKDIVYTALYNRPGVIIVTTKRGVDQSSSYYTPGIIAYTPKGYYAIREFYSPQYTPQNTVKEPDSRSTVYWQPNLMTDNSGIVKFNYYNTDQSGTYRVVIEGINEKGQLARKVYTYEVK